MDETSLAGDCGVRPDFELVVPAYNEARSLPALVNAAAIAAERAGFLPGSFYMVVVDNGSMDETPSILAELSTTPQGRFMRTVRVERNRGYGFGIMTGLRATTAELIGWSHADLQCDLNDAFRCLNVLRDVGINKAIVKGHRKGRAVRDVLVSRTYEAVVRAVLGVHIKEINAQPKVFHRSLLERLHYPPDDFAFDAYVLYKAVKAGLEIVEVPVEFPPRLYGVSKWAATMPSRFRTMVSTVRTLHRAKTMEPER